MLTSSDRYNLLPEVESASDNLNQIGKINAINALLDVVEYYNYSDRLGVRLVHKHFSLNDDEIMLEHEDTSFDEFALTTSPKSKINLTDCVPNSWILSNGEYVPAEYSGRSLLQADAPCPQTTPELFSKFRYIAESLGVADLLGPQVLYQASVEQRKPAGEMILLEESNLARRSSTVRFRPISSTNSNIETTWSRTVSGANGGAILACSKACYTHPEGGHSGATFHARS